MIDINIFFEKLKFSKECRKFFDTYNINEYESYKNLFYMNEDVFFEKLDNIIDSDKFILKFYILLALEVADCYKFDEQIFFDTMSDIKIWQERYYRNTDKIGLMEYKWLANILKMRVFRFGRLQFEPDICKSYLFDADICELDLIEANICKGKTAIDHFLKARDIEVEILKVHIPEGEKLDIKACSDSFELAKKYFQRAKYFTCMSWLLSPKLYDLLDENSNILKFANFFELKGLCYDVEQAKQRVLEFKSSKETSLSKKLREYIDKNGDIGMGYGIKKI